MKLRNNPTLITGFILLFLVLFISLFLPIFYKTSPYEINLSKRLSGPILEFPLGTDGLGRDALARISFGGRISLFVGTAVVLISSIIGLIMGLISGWIGKFFDEIIGRIIDILLAFPGVLLTLSVITFLGPSLLNLILSLSLTGWAGYARMIRAQVLKLKELEFILAAKAMGASSSRIIYHHLLPNVLPFLYVQASLGISGAILAESSLSFLGLGVQPPSPSWGGMIYEGRNYLFENPLLSIFPGIALLITILTFNFIGEGLRKSLKKK
ncbi:MAG: ABC transporter permease [Acidobacteriota bacterium]